MVILDGRHISTVAAFRAEVAAVKYHKHKRERFVTLLKTLDSETRQLLTFCCWHCLFNFRFQAIDESKYYSIPPREGGDPAFEAFIDLLRYYNRRKVTPSREQILIHFLSGCSGERQDFYLSLLSKGFIKDLPLTDIQLELELNEIDAGEIYGSISRLKTGFSELSYPVVISAIHSADFPLCAYVKHAKGQHSLSFQHEQGTFVKIDPLLPADTRYIITPKLALLGFAGALPSGRTILHPIDYFGSMKEFRLYRKGRAELPFEQRIRELRTFQAGNFLTQVTTQYVGFANSEQEVLPELVKAMCGSGYNQAVISDQDTARTGRAFTAGVSTTVGVIESFLVENGQAAGFQIWFNGALFPVAFDFSGRNNALLHDIAPCKGKLLEFLYLHVGAESVGVGTKILWDAPLWRPKRMKHRGIYIEKCALCGSVTNPHARRGVCKSCERNLYQIFDQYGPDNWIIPAKPTREKRLKSCWEPRLLNTVRYVHKGCLLEAREDGCWRFKSQEENERNRGENNEPGNADVLHQ